MNFVLIKVLQRAGKIVSMDKMTKNLPEFAETLLTFSMVLIPPWPEHLLLQLVQAGGVPEHEPPNSGAKQDPTVGPE